MCPICDATLNFRSKLSGSFFSPLPHTSSISVLVDDTEVWVLRNMMISSFTPAKASGLAEWPPTVSGCCKTPKPKLFSQKRREVLWLPALYGEGFFSNERWKPESFQKTTHMLEDIQGPCSTHKKFFFKLNLKKKSLKFSFWGVSFWGGGVGGCFFCTWRERTE